MRTALRLLCASLLLGLLPGLVRSQAVATGFTGTIEELPDIPPSVCLTTNVTKCDTCQNVCGQVTKCLKTAKAKTSNVVGASYGAFISASDDPECKNFIAEVATPSAQATTPDANADPGAYVVKTVSASFTVASPLTYFERGEFYSDNVVRGDIVAQCDGMTMYFSPGGLCSCSVKFKVTDGKVMGVDATQKTFDPAVDATPTTLGSIYGVRTKVNPSAADFKVCNDTFMGANPQPTADGKSTFPFQCFRRLIVQQASISRYNQSICGSQLYFFNMGNDQAEPTCRDGLGVITPGTNGGNDSISSPAGVFFHRDPSVVPAEVNGTADDPQWFFSLTPAKLPLNSSTQLDLALTLLTGSGSTARQVQCIAEYMVQPDTSTGVTYAAPILGFSPQPAEPNAASRVAVAAAALLLPALLSLL